MQKLAGKSYLPPNKNIRKLVKVLIHFLINKLLITPQHYHYIPIGFAPAKTESSCKRGEVLDVFKLMTLERVRVKL